MALISCECSPPGRPPGQAGVFGCACSVKLCDRPHPCAAAESGLRGEAAAQQSLVG